VSHQQHLGRRERTTDTLHASHLARMAATLDRGTVPEVLPPLWHWMLFAHWVRPAELGPDGHPARGTFLPADPDLPRRMYAGGRLSFPGTLRAGAAATRDSSIIRVEEKTGSTGRLLFVTVRHEISGPSGLAITEEHDIVYRGLAGAAAKPGAPFENWPEAFEATVTPDPVLLFRYSALTGNGHRIHYDRTYVTEVEGYPGLIVHGPLQATLLAELAQRHAPGRRLAGFEFRAVRPVFDLAPFRLVGHWRGANQATLAVVDHAGQSCMRAEAVFE
jgi:3-methylfumaryl-CoA hydratase